MRYKTLSQALKTAYGCEVGKICIDGGFTCPNRDGTVGVGGCIFCGERGAGEHIRAGVDVGRQVSDFFAREHRQKKFIAYFQNFTNTYAAPDVLRARYTAALTDERIVVLAVGTRPDCIDDGVIAVLREMQSRTDVWVELGLQTASDATAEKIHRGYKTEVFVRAVKALHAAGIPVVVHIMIGLPDETEEDVAATVSLLNTLPIAGIKIHSLYVMKHTQLDADYRAGRFLPPTLDYYVKEAVYVLTHISPDLVVHRVTGDCPPGELSAPDWNADKNRVIDAIRKTLEDNGWEQGCLRHTP